MVRFPQWPTVEVDLTELDVECAFDRISQSPSVSQIPTPLLPSARDTERPSAKQLQVLQQHSRSGEVEQPTITFDRELSCVTLVTPYLVSVLDRYNNEFRILCDAGLVVGIERGVSATDFFKELRRELVKAQLKKAPFADIVPFTKDGSHQIFVDPQWQKAILDSMM